MSTPRWQIDTVRSRPTDATLAQLGSLAGTARSTDGHPPFSDQTLVSLRGGDADGRRVTTLLARERDRADAAAAPVGAAVLVADGDGAPLLELVVAPRHRRAGAASALLAAAAALPETRDAGVRTWSHGDHPAARVLADRNRYTVVRELWRMSAPVAAVAPANAVPASADGTRVRAFRPGDEAALLDLNRAAFAHHPEQGALTAGDLADLMAQDWFDADGLFLAERTTDPATGGPLLGFHWTKIDPAEPDEGEIYVLGVHPDAQGRGLGRVLTAAGLAHLRRRGVETITLYVDADNTAAVRLYTAVGFVRADVDVLYAPATGAVGSQ
ncbi:mycothiol acetyltransferase [Tersicoccus solisilvae]|uniref:Mycothiol acetyltransferase n=1 Tax=Tersicoccus solisilvae TaxID=1882339 RepID=A0ABQ1NWB4_9MICC|nr:mycothiol synthase [Tersicoccus solisilvae]GGC86416.1 mycothiol acetyltransferase [Tersicoccus solisilvae]